MTIERIAFVCCYYRWEFDLRQKQDRGISWDVSRKLGMILRWLCAEIVDLKIKGKLFSEISCHSVEQG